MSFAVIICCFRCLKFTPHPPAKKTGEKQFLLTWTYSLDIKPLAVGASRHCFAFRGHVPEGLGSPILVECHLVLYLLCQLLTHFRQGVVVH